MPCETGWLVPTEHAAAAAYDRGLLLGDGLFETLRLVAGRLPFAREHLCRLAEGARLLGFPNPPVTPAVLGALLEVNTQAVAGGLAPSHEPLDGVVRITYTRGPGQRGYDPPESAEPFCLIHVLPGAPSVHAPWRAVVSKVPIAPHPVLSRVKHTSALPRILARQEARAAGANEALIVTPSGEVAEGAATNLFWVQEDELFTPSLLTGCLPGVARTWLLGWAREMGMRVRVGRFRVDQLAAGSEAFLTNAVFGPIPLTEVAGLVQWSAPGPLTDRAAAAWQRALKTKDASCPVDVWPRRQEPERD